MTEQDAEQVYRQWDATVAAHREHPLLFGLAYAFIVGIFASMFAGHAFVQWAHSSGIAETGFGYWVAIVIGAVWLLGYIELSKFIRRRTDDAR